MGTLARLYVKARTLGHNVRLALGAKQELYADDFAEESAVDTWASRFGKGQVPVDWYDDDLDPATFRAEYAEMVNDPAIKAALLALLFEVCALELKVTPASSEGTDDGQAQEIAEFIRYCLAGSVAGGSARGLLMKMLKPALTHQFSVSEIVLVEEVSGRFDGKWTLKALKSKDVTKGQWVFVLDQFKNVLKLKHLEPTGQVEFPPDKFLVYSFLADFENPRGVSHLRAAYRMWWVKRLVIRAWAKHAEFQGIVPVGHYTTDAQRPKLEAQMEKFHARRWAAVPQDVKFEVIRLADEGTTSGHEKVLRWIDEQIFLSIRLAFLQVLQSDQGSRAKAEVSRGQAGLLVWYLASDLAAFLAEHLVKLLVRLNYGEGIACPTVKIEAPEVEELTARATIVKTLADMRVPMSVRALQEEFGVEAPDPEDPDDALAGPPPAPSPFGGLPFGGGGPPFGGGPGLPPATGGAEPAGKPTLPEAAPAEAGEGPPPGAPVALASGDPWLVEFARAYEAAGREKPKAKEA